MLSDLLVDFYITFLFPVVKYILVNVIISIEGPWVNGRISHLDLKKTTTFLQRKVE